MSDVNSIPLFDALAPRYDQVLPMFAELGRAVVGSLDLRHGERVLDVGCGRGAIALAAVAVGADVTAVDASAAMTRALQHDAPRLDVRLMDACELTFDDDTFELAVAAFVANVVGDQHRLTAEMSRVVVPGGRVVLVLPGRVDPSWEPFFTLFGAFEPRPGAERTAQPADATALLTGAGLSDLDTWEVTVDLPVDSPEQAWEQSMTHGFAGYVASLAERDQQAFRNAVFDVLGAMAEAGSLRLIRTAEVTCARVP